MVPNVAVFVDVCLREAMSTVKIHWQVLLQTRSVSYSSSVTGTHHQAIQFLAQNLHFPKLNLVIFLPDCIHVSVIDYNRNLKQNAQLSHWVVLL